MISLRTLVFGILLTPAWCYQGLVFPSNFKFGAATSALQIEGAWNVSGRGESIWDRYSHVIPSRIADGSTGDVACDSYHFWKRDIEIAAELGLDHYRFSISWSRLLPTGFLNVISEDGVKYYNDLINELLARGVEPLVTIHHFDLPQNIQDKGGWNNPVIVDWFGDYARTVFSLYADRVKTWITINEVLSVCDGGYGGFNAPGIIDLDISVYLCTKNVILAHAKAWRIYDQEFKPIYHGKVSMNNLFFWYEPLAKQYEKLTDLTRELCDQRFTHPIYSKEGGWPQALENVLLKNSIVKGFKKSRLPPFTKEEIDFVRGTYDFYALNHYTSFLVREPRFNETIGDWPLQGSDELGAVFEHGVGWKTAAPSWFGIYPEGIRHQLNWIREKYGNVSILITENGYANNVTGLHDQARIDYIRDYLKQIWLAINVDKVNVIGYTVWSLMDTFEGPSGYTVNFGLYDVDFDSKQRTRTPRDSAHFYSTVAKTKTLIVE